MKLAIYQGPSLEGDIDAALATIESTLACVSLGGAQMAVFPELFLPGYNQPDLHQSLSQTKDSDWEKQLSDLVIPIVGDRTRVVSIFSFFDRPDVVFSPKDQVRFYGRACNQSHE